MMDARAAKLALARQKLKDHQVKKTLVPQKDDNSEETPQDVQQPYPITNYPDHSDHIHVDPVPFDPAHISVIEPEQVLPRTEIAPIEIESAHSREFIQTYQHETNTQQFAPSATVHENQFAPTAATHQNQFAPTAATHQNQFTLTAAAHQNQFAPTATAHYNQNQFASSAATHYNQFASTATGHHNQFAPTIEPDVNVTEILISSKRNLENQISELQTKLVQLESSQVTAINENVFCKQQINSLQQEIQNLKQKYLRASEEIDAKEAIIKELNKLKLSLTDENNNLQEQLEFTKTMLTAKESDNTALQNQLHNLQNQLDVTQLHLQQISNGNQINIGQQQKKVHDTEILQHKISTLEQQLKTMQKERDQINIHYEHYVTELNEQLKTLAIKNEELNNEVTRLSNREAGLIEQISDMEIRLQNFQIIAKRQPFVDQPKVYDDLQELQQNYSGVQANFEQLSTKYEELQRLYAESEAKIKELNHALEEASQQSECSHDNISISKLNADITSDKIAAQRAAEQNKKMKTDLQELEEAFVKISTDKLELTEKVAAEKFLNRELTIKLAEFEEKAKDMHTKLMAKDEEMIRLQTSYRELEREVNKIKQTVQLEDKTEAQDVTDRNGDADEEAPEQATEAINACNNNTEDEYHCLMQTKEEHSSKIPKEDAMVKLQERFLKIMGEVADLSDEKHRLEHIILQLQNETDTICEYVALYQQQRSLLKKRDEERTAQIKIFQMECQQLKNQLEELSGIIIRLAKDTELAVYFKAEPRQSDLAKVMNLLSNLRSSSLVDPMRTSSELKNFYPCSCCSGQLIDI